jgi:hypothetical protein
MTTAKWTSIQERSRIHAIVLQDLMKRGVCRCGVEMLLESLEFSTPGTMGVFRERGKKPRGGSFIQLGKSLPEPSVLSIKWH